MLIKHCSAFTTHWCLYVIRLTHVNRFSAFKFLTASHESYQLFVCLFYIPSFSYLFLSSSLSSLDFVCLPYLFWSHSSTCFLYCVSNVACGRVVVVDLSDERGEVKNLRCFPTAYGSDFLKERETLVLLRVDSESFALLFLHFKQISSFIGFHWCQSSWFVIFE